MCFGIFYMEVFLSLILGNWVLYSFLIWSILLKKDEFQVYSFIFPELKFSIFGDYIGKNLFLSRALLSILAKFYSEGMVLKFWMLGSWLIEFLVLLI